MTTSPAGMWVGKTNPDVSLDIEDGGFIKITRGSQEQIGSWASSGKDAIKATFADQPYDLSFQRRDLKLTITLPGENTPSEFEQM